MNELRGRDLSAFRRCDIDTATIAFKEKFREKQRQEKLQRRNESLDQLAEEVILCCAGVGAFAKVVIHCLA